MPSDGSGFFVNHLIVERYIIIGGVTRAHFDGFTRMLVQLPRDGVGDAVAPVMLLTHRQEDVLAAFQYGAQAELRIGKEAQQQLQGAVACTTTEAVGMAWAGRSGRAGLRPPGGSDRWLRISVIVNTQIGHREHLGRGS